ncbi:hypothetical protein [Paenibacillus chitinolyticus]|uniref:hypothetical protein n=1 Tax=Paenibacillus chitinolyticus TaxID=79263 RepID=UPI0036729AA2
MAKLYLKLLYNSGIEREHEIESSDPNISTEQLKEVARKYFEELTNNFNKQSFTFVYGDDQKFTTINFRQVCEASFEIR